MPPTDPRSNARSDQELVADLNAGDASAFDALYYRYRDRVMRLAFRFTGNHADAQDVLQEAFAYLYRKFPGFVLTAQITTFLYPVVRNLSLEVRRKRRASESDEQLDQMAGFAPAGAGAAREELVAVLGGLSSAHREAVLLRFVDDLTIDEIAAATAVPAGTVKSRLHHAIAILRDDPRVRRFFDFP